MAHTPVFTYITADLDVRYAIHKCPYFVCICTEGGRESVQTRSLVDQKWAMEWAFAICLVDFVYVQHVYLRLKQYTCVLFVSVHIHVRINDSEKRESVKYTGAIRADVQKPRKKEWESWEGRKKIKAKRLSSISAHILLCSYCNVSLRLLEERKNWERWNTIVLFFCWNKKKIAKRKKGVK